MRATTFLYKSDPVRGRQWAAVFQRRAPEIDFRIWPDIGDPSQVRFLAAWEPPVDIATRYPRLEVLFSSGAGVDQFSGSVDAASGNRFQSNAWHGLSI